jgi:hypothetical protein
MSASNGSNLASFHRRFGQSAFSWIYGIGIFSAYKAVLAQLFTAAAYYFDPATGRKFDQGAITATAKTSEAEAKPVTFKKNLPSPQDWVLVLENTEKK